MPTAQKLKIHYAPLWNSRRDQKQHQTRVSYGLLWSRRKPDGRHIIISKSHIWALLNALYITCTEREKPVVNLLPTRWPIKPSTFLALGAYPIHYIIIIIYNYTYIIWCAFSISCSVDERIIRKENHLYYRYLQVFICVWAVWVTQKKVATSLCVTPG